MPTVICGIPNAGKTTLSERFQHVIHVDDGRLFDELESAPADVCIEGIFCFASERRCVSRMLPHPRRLIWLDISLDESIGREKRGRRDGALAAFAASFEHPSMREGWDEIIRIGGKE